MTFIHYLDKYLTYTICSSGGINSVWSYFFSSSFVVVLMCCVFYKLKLITVFYLVHFSLRKTTLRFQFYYVI